MKRSLSTLPEPGAEELRHSERLLEVLRARIAAAGGWIPFDRFMNAALYEPGLGYYSAGAAKLGGQGDFITAPELGGLFARRLAVQLAAILEEVPGGAVLELGAGTGALAAGLLGALAQLGRLPERYLILEVSADLRERQRRRLAGLPPALAARVEWIERLPPALEGVVLANEVADALPVRRFEWRGGAVLEIGVAVDDDLGIALREATRPADAAFAAAVRSAVGSAGSPLPDGYRSELCTALGPWIGSLSATLGRGALLLVDYGLPRAQLYLPERSEGTLLCHYRHRAHADALRWVGLQDITAWVDFTAVAEAAVDGGLEVAGFATQAGFLLALGIEAQVASAGDERERLRLAAEARQLLLPGEMGEAFKAIALTRGLDGALRGFSLQDLRPSL